MNKLGLIGGMSFEGSTLYYRKINEAVRDRLGDLHSADLIMHSVDFQKIVDMQKSDRWDDAGRYLASVAQGLERAGADCVMMCAVTMHLVAPAVEAAVSVPFIHIVDVTADALKAAGCKRPLLLATRYTMENGFYPARMATHGLDVVVPDMDGRAETHRIIFEELCAGRVLDSSRATLVKLIEKAKADGADSIIFGCTEVGMILDEDHCPVPAFDSTHIHAMAGVEFALTGKAKR
ncbi:aspartate/glutamate racemase family protein [Brevundimonas vesicularis]|uniref:aspartate/glutamate racemase family protein n=1 Tax=Brevundimonas vesicularis TaxID=41276 RepID=UPI0030C14DB3